MSECAQRSQIIHHLCSPAIKYKVDCPHKLKSLMTICFLMSNFNYHKWKVHTICIISKWNVYPQQKGTSPSSTTSMKQKTTFQNPMSVTHGNDSKHTFLKFRNLNYHQIYKSVAFYSSCLMAFRVMLNFTAESMKLSSFLKMSNWNPAAVSNERKCLFYENGVAYPTLHQGKIKGMR